MNHPPDIRDDERSLWERPGTVRWIWRSLIFVCLVVAILPFALIATHNWAHEPHFAGRTGIEAALAFLADEVPVFYAIVGFVSFAFIVLAGQHLRRILMRPEDYYASGPDTADKDRVAVKRVGEDEGERT